MIGITPKITDAELITLAVMAALLRFTSEARWLRYARAHLGHLFRYLPQQPGYNKRLRALAPTLEWLISTLSRETSLWTDDGRGPVPRPEDDHLVEPGTGRHGSDGCRRTARDGLAGALAAPDPRRGRRGPAETRSTGGDDVRRRAPAWWPGGGRRGG